MSPAIKEGLTIGATIWALNNFFDFVVVLVKGPRPSQMQIKNIELTVKGEVPKK